MHVVQVDYSKPYNMNNFPYFLEGEEQPSNEKKVSL